MPGDKTNSITLKSKEITAVLGTPPRWLIRWGSLHILLVVLLLVALSAFISYPDTITTDAVITVTDTGSIVYPVQPGRLSACLVHNNQAVEKGQPLLVISHTMGGQDTLRASSPGTVITDRLFKPGDSLTTTDRLFTIRSFTANPHIVLVMQPAQSAQLQPGMSVNISLAGYPPDVFGALRGRLRTRPVTVRQQDICQVELSAPWPDALSIALLHTSIRGTATVTTAEKPFLQRVFQTQKKHDIHP
jgi:hypothetical protein